MSVEDTLIRIEGKLDEVLAIARGFGFGGPKPAPPITPPPITQPPAPPLAPGNAILLSFGNPDVRVLQANVPYKYSTAILCNLLQIFPQGAHDAFKVKVEVDGAVLQDGISNEIYVQDFFPPKQSPVIVVTVATTRQYAVQVN